MIHGFLPQGMPINIIGENGILGVGPYPAPGKEDSEILNAGNVDFLLISEFVLNNYYYFFLRKPQPPCLKPLSSAVH